jgi:hypothetical protein
LNKPVAEIPTARKDAEVNTTDKMAARLTLLESVNISPADLETIADEIEDNQRIVAELEAFAQNTPWISHQIQPPEKKA